MSAMLEYQCLILCLWFAMLNLKAASQVSAQSTDPAATGNPNAELGINLRSYHTS